MKCYKIFELDKDGNLCTLFHGVNGSRKLNKNILYTANSKLVSDGGTKYMSGFHVLPTRNEAKQYMRSFKVRLDRLVIKEVEINKFWSKKHSRSNVLLAKEMTIL